MEWVRQCAGTRGSIFRGYPRWRRAHKELGSSHLEPSHPAHRENLGRVEDCVLRTAAALPTLTVGYRPTTVQLRWLRSRVLRLRRLAQQAHARAMQELHRPGRRDLVLHGPAPISRSPAHVREQPRRTLTRRLRQGRTTMAPMLTVRSSPGPPRR